MDLWHFNKVYMKEKKEHFYSSQQEGLVLFEWVRIIDELRGTGFCPP